MKGIIDRFEGNFAVIELENQSMMNIERSQLPETASEGDCIVLQNGKYVVDEGCTENRKKRIQNLMDELFE